MSELNRIGIDLGGTKISAVRMNSAGEVINRRRLASPQDNYQETLQTITDLVLSLEQGQVCHVGIGTPGAETHSGGMKNCNSTWLNGQPFRVDLERSLNRPVRIANDANCFALSEASDGAGQGAQSVFGVILGTGVGGGWVINGDIVQGVNGIAGEWGHNSLPNPDEEERPGPACYCGRTGCIETWLSGPGLSADYKRQAGVSLTAEKIIASCNTEARAAKALDRYCHRLARSLATVINICDPAVIVLGGGLSKTEQLYQRVPELWSQWVFSDEVRTKLLPPKHGDDSGVRGAAWLWPAD